MEELSVYLGRHRRGTKLSILLKVALPPDATPIVDFWLEGTTKILTARMPLVSSNFFALDQYLGDEFDDGAYVATIRYDVATARQPQQFRYFDVRGGDSTGHVIAVHPMRRPLGDAVVTVCEDGTARIGYKPRLGS